MQITKLSGSPLPTNCPFRPPDTVGTVHCTEPSDIRVVFNAPAATERPFSSFSFRFIIGQFFPSGSEPLIYRVSDKNSPESIKPTYDSHYSTMWEMLDVNILVVVDVLT